MCQIYFLILIFIPMLRYIFIVLIFFWFFRTMVLERTQESLGLQGDQTSQSYRKSVLNIHWKDWCWSWSSNTLTTWCKEPTHGPLNAKNGLIGKDPNAGKDWRQEEKETTEDEMVGWHHRLDGHEFERALGVGDAQESLACRSPWRRKESDMTEWLNWTELAFYSE